MSVDSGDVINMMSCSIKLRRAIFPSVGGSFQLAPRASRNRLGMCEAPKTKKPTESLVGFFWWSAPGESGIRGSIKITRRACEVGKKEKSRGGKGNGEGRTMGCPRPPRETRLPCRPLSAALACVIKKIGRGRSPNQRRMNEKPFEENHALRCP